MTRYARKVMRHTVDEEHGVPEADYRAAMDLIDELEAENEALNARLFRASREWDAVIAERDGVAAERDAVTRVCAALQQRVDALRAHDRVTEGAGR